MHGGVSGYIGSACRAWRDRGLTDLDGQGRSDETNRFDVELNAPLRLLGKGPRDPLFDRVSPLRRFSVLVDHRSLG
jgi:hypothetical protein